jgi:hypothetical protein
MSLNIITVTLNMGMEGPDGEKGRRERGLGFLGLSHMAPLHREVQLPGHLHCGPK